MARERERMREAEVEPKLHSTPMHISRIAEKQHIRSLPRVIKTGQVPTLRSPSWREGQPQAAGMAILLPYHYANFEEMKYPIYTMTCWGRPGRFRPQQHQAWAGHRHFFEALFYMPNGGYGREFQDGVYYDWKDEGILMVPTYVHHRHYIDQPASEGDFTVISRTFEWLGTADFESQLDRKKEFWDAFGHLGEAYLATIVGLRNPELETLIHSRRAVSPWRGPEPRSIYDRYLKLLADEADWYRTAPRFIPSRDVPWEDTPMGRLKYMVHPWKNTSLRALNVFFQELPPGGSSGKHRHIYEEVLLVLEGKGYDVHDGQRHDWEATDVVCIPGMTAHQHFNADPSRPAKFMSAHTRWYMYAGLGGIEHLEDAPGYRAAP